MEKKGKLDATASEDMAALPLGSVLLLRKLTYSQNKDERVPVVSYKMSELLRDLLLESHQQFVDLCILLGSDFCKSPLHKYSLPSDQGESRSRHLSVFSD